MVVLFKINKALLCLLNYELKSNATTNALATSIWTSFWFGRFASGRFVDYDALAAFLAKGSSRKLVGGTHIKFAQIRLELGWVVVASAREGGRPGMWQEG